AIISGGEERTQQQSDSSVQQGEGEDFRTGRKALGLRLLTMSKGERKSNYSVDSYFKDTLRPRLPILPCGSRTITRAGTCRFKIFLDFFG
ncbi:hypothetical protein F5887DRAFT_1008439, partial [Amanita rubescens]